MASIHAFRRSIGVAVALLLSSSAPARAQQDQRPDPWERGVTAQQMQQAHLHFQLGLALHKQLLLQEAAAEYEAALSQWKHPKIHFYLSRVWMKLGRPVATYEALLEALRWGRRGLAQHDYELARQMQRDLLGTQVAELEVACEEAGAEVTLDGTSLFIGPAQRRVIVSAGKHQIVARKPEHLTETRSIALFPGERKRIEVELRAVDEITKPTRLWASWKPWAVVGSGAVVLMAGGVMHRISATNFASYDREFTERCMLGGGCPDGQVSDLTDRLHWARRQQQIAISSYVAGGVTMACGLILVYLNKPKMVTAPLLDWQSSNIALVPGLLSPGVGVSAVMRF
jgi:hypothetical protein